MKRPYIKALLFWLVLLVIAIVNASIREGVYKPLLAPYIGMWAHQLSSITGIAAFYVAIYWFLRLSKFTGTKKELVLVGLIWIVMTILFECWMNLYVRQLSFQEVIETYYFWKGELWPFVLLSLIASPLIAHQRIITSDNN